MDDSQQAGRDSRDEAAEAVEEVAGESRGRHLMVRALVWGVLTLVLLWWFERSYRY